MSETSTELAIPSSALLCADLMRVYGDTSHHDGVRQQARFEVSDPSGKEYSLLLTQRGLGSSAVYKINIHETLNGRDELIFTMQAGMPVTERLKSDGVYIGSSCQTTNDSGSELLYGSVTTTGFGNPENTGW